MHTRTGARPRGVSMLMMLMMSMLVASIALAADITGKWKAEFDAPDGTKATNTFTFKMDGEKVTGGVLSSLSGTEAPIEDGTLKGDDLSFGLTRNFGGQEMKFRYKGKVKGDEIALTVSGDAGGQTFEIQMNAKREKP
jgi:hypothetical protein